MEEMTNNMLGQILDQSARARLNNIAMVDANKAKKVEAMLITMARQGQVVENSLNSLQFELLDFVENERKSFGRSVEQNSWRQKVRSKV